MIKNKYRLLNIIILIFIFMYIVFALFGTNEVGIANNGDYNRTIYPLGMDFLKSQNFFYYIDKFEIATESESVVDILKFILFEDKENIYEYVSTQSIIIKMAMVGNVIYNKIVNAELKIFDLSFLGLIYSALYSLAIWLIYRFNKKENFVYNALLLSMLLFIFCDIGYLLYFNSFFGEAVTVVFLLMTFGLATYIFRKDNFNILGVVLFYISAIMFTGGKVANSVLGFLIAIFSLSFLLIRRDKLMKMVVVFGSIILILVSGYFYNSSPKWMNDVTTYQSVFFGILKDSDTPEKDVEELGLDKKYAVLKDTHGYGSDYPLDIKSDEFSEDFYEKITPFNVLKFYLKHPVRFIDKLKISAENSINISPAYLGNYKSEDKLERLALTKRFSFYSELRKNVSGHSFEFIIAFLTLYLIIIIYNAVGVLKDIKNNKNKLVHILFYFLLWMSTSSQFVIPIIGNGEADLAKHMFLFIACFDIMIILGILYIFNNISKLVYCFTNMKKKYKVISLSLIVVSILLIFTPNLYKQLFARDTLTIGDYIELGEYKDEKILWQIINIDDEKGILLFSDKILDTLPYSHKKESGNDNRDNFGSNLWEESFIRKWLNDKDSNDGFLEDFNENEINLIEDTKVKSVLSYMDISKAEGGNRPIYWTYTPMFVKQNYDNAYYITTMDKVFLLSINEFNEYVFNNKLSTEKYYIDNGKKKKHRYWLRTCYYSNSSMVRIVEDDGFVYNKDTIVEDVGVVPSVYIKNSTSILEGKGTKANPYKIKSTRR